jgi:peptidoglycan/xylan/chitin deacetylase (PgdA/CDA1 family)
MVSDEYVPHVSPLYRFRSTTEFAADLKFFLRHFTPVSLSDIVGALNGGRTISRNSIHLTFDDGFREMHEVVVPMLLREGIPATFFLNTAFLNGGGLAHYNALSLVLDRLQNGVSHPSQACIREVESLLGSTSTRGDRLDAKLLSIPWSRKELVQRVAETVGVDIKQYVHATQPCLTYGQVEDLVRKGFSIGGHSHEHPLYADLPLAAQLEQTRMSMDCLAGRFPMREKAFAFPHNDTGVGPQFFDAVFSTDMLHASFGTSGLVAHFHSHNIERFTMEKTEAPAASILAKQYVRSTYYRLRPRARTAAEIKTHEHAAEGA